jgi:uncharacterized protein YuzE
MKITYDQDTDTLTVLLRECAVAESDEVREGIIIDYDESGMACAIEILDASEKVTDPDGIAYEMKAKRR